MDFAQRFERVLSREVQGDVVCGDCLEVMAVMPDGSVDLVVTSPPYYQIIQYKDSVLSYNSLEEYFQWLNECINSIGRILAPDGLVIFITGLYVQFDRVVHIPAKTIALFETNGFVLYNEIIWYKPKGCQGLWTRAMTEWLKGRTDQPIFATQHEYIHVYNRGTRKQLDCHNETFIKRVAWSVWEHRVSTMKGHPCPFPVDVIMNLIKCYSVSTDLVFDPFIGSGTTAVVADCLGRHWFGCDISEEYVEMALGRISQDRLRRSQLSLEGI